MIHELEAFLYGRRTLLHLFSIVRTSVGNRNSMPDQGKIVQALFNHRSCSDLTLVVNGVPFYCHRVVMQSECEYLRLDNWPGKRGDGDDASTVQIGLPDIQAPAPFRTELDHSNTFWFEIYLKVVYDLHRLSAKNLEEVFAVYQIADFMISPEIKATCDTVLSSVSYDQNSVLPCLLFSQKFSLPETLARAKKVAAGNLRWLWATLLLYDIDLLHFTDIMMAVEYSTDEQFLIILCYPARLVPKEGMFPIDYDISDPDMIKLCKDILPRICSKWDRRRARWTYETFRALTVNFAIRKPTATSCSNCSSIVSIGSVSKKLLFICVNRALFAVVRSSRVRSETSLFSRQAILAAVDRPKANR